MLNWRTVSSEFVSALFYSLFSWYQSFETSVWPKIPLLLLIFFLFFFSSSDILFWFLFFNSLQKRKTKVLLLLLHLILSFISRKLGFSSTVPSSSASLSFSAAGQPWTFFISNCGSLISVSLENHNYLLWKPEFLPVLWANGLIGFVDGTNPCPPEFLNDADGNAAKEVNPSLSAWNQQDQNVLCWINATLSKGLLAHVVGLTSARSALKRRFASLSKSYIIQLKTQLQHQERTTIHYRVCSEDQDYLW